MKMLPCKKCSKCGIYYDLTVSTCDCGQDLTEIPALLVDVDEIDNEHPELYGKIDKKLSIFQQKCSFCGKLSFTHDLSMPVKICYNCRKKRIGSVDPIPFEDADVSADKSPEHSQEEESPRGTPQENSDSPIQTCQQKDDDELGEDEAEALLWLNMYGNIQNAVSGAAPTAPEATAGVCAENESLSSTNGISGISDVQEDDIDWGAVLGEPPTSQAKPEIQPKKVAADIMLSAIRYGSHSFVVPAKSGVPYMLGRSANQSGFLSQDVRVGNEHCWLVFRDGHWFVKDNHSANGTIVNARYIGLNGECVLHDGDELKLGHEQDSMSFRVALK